MLKLFLKGQVKQEPSHVYMGTDERNPVPSQADDQRDSAQRGSLKRVLPGWAGLGQCAKLEPGESQTYSQSKKTQVPHFFHRTTDAKGQSPAL